MNIPWYITALGAALIWGVHYPLVDFALKRVSVFSVLLLTVLPVLLLMPVFLRDVANDLDAVRVLPVRQQAMIAAIGLSCDWRMGLRCWTTCMLSAGSVMSGGRFLLPEEIHCCMHIFWNCIGPHPTGDWLLQSWEILRHLQKWKRFWRSSVRYIFR